MVKYKINLVFKDKSLNEIITELLKIKLINALDLKLLMERRNN